jgi:hypothetical protein
LHTPNHPPPHTHTHTRTRAHTRTGLPWKYKGAKPQTQVAQTPEEMEARAHTDEARAHTNVNGAREMGDANLAVPTSLAEDSEEAYAGWEPVPQTLFSPVGLPRSGTQVSSEDCFVFVLLYYQRLPLLPKTITTTTTTYTVILLTQ